MDEKIETILELEDAKSFFPQDLADRFGIEEIAMSYFGVFSQKHFVYESQSVVNKGFYVVALAISRETEREEFSNISFEKSKSKWIRLEHYEFQALRNNPKYENYLPGYPLIALRIHNWCQPRDSPFRFAELLRYADHKQFRRRGIAAATLESVCKRMRQEGTEFIYVNYDWKSWPRSSLIVPARYTSDVRLEIMGCFPEGWCNYRGKLDDFSDTFLSCRNNGFFIFTDPEKQEVEHRKAMVELEDYKRIKTS